MPLREPTTIEKEPRRLPVSADPHKFWLAVSDPDRTQQRCSICGRRVDDSIHTLRVDPGLTIARRVLEPVTLLMHLLVGVRGDAGVALDTVVYCTTRQQGYCQEHRR